MTVFTGIVEEVGTVTAVDRGRCSAVLTIQAHTVLEDARVGDSIAVNGICLTVTGRTAGSFTADVMHETLDRSSLAGLRPGTEVNLERAMAAGGHVDGVGRVQSVRRDDNAVWYTVSAPPHLLRYIVEKGSITVDGISLTVARVDGNSFAISAIPHTVAQTVLRNRRPGDLVNLENDIIGKYVEKLLTPAPETRVEGGITKEFLAQYGF